MEECFLHRNSVNTNKEKLVALSSVDGWKTILNAGRIRGCEKVIALAATTNAGDFPNIKFHKTCRGLFTMKKDLEKLKKKEASNSESQAGKNVRSKSSTSRERGILEKRCIFCKTHKYLAHTKSREKLSSCMMFSADEKIKQASKIRKDSELMILTAADLIAKEACYHASYYRAYTIIINNAEKARNTQQNEEKSDDEEAFEYVKETLDELYHSPDVVPFTDISDRYTEKLGTTNVEESRIVSLKKNLRRKLMNHLTGFEYIEINRRYFIYPDTLELKSIVEKHILLQKEYEEATKCSDNKKAILDAVKVLRNEITNLKV